MTDERAVHVVVPGSLATLTGGYHYDRRVIEALRTQGRTVEVHELPGDYPWPDETAKRQAEDLFEALPEHAVVLVDGLAFGVLPAVVSRASRRLSLIALVHHPLAAESGLDNADRQQLFASERQSLASARGVITTSAATTASLAEYGVIEERIATVMPGTAAAELAVGSPSGSGKLLCVATITPRKGHVNLIDALAGVDHREWHLDCVGGTARDLACTARVREAMTRHGLHEQVTLHDELDGDALAAHYAQADLFVLATHFEGYGMVFDEAIAHGLPIIASGAGAVATTVPAAAGLVVAADDTAALQQTLQHWFDDGDLRRQLRDGARDARERQRSWSTCGLEFGAALDRFTR